LKGQPPPDSDRPLAASDLSPDDFRAAGHRLIDELADFYASLPLRRVTPGESVGEIRALLGNGPLPESGAPAAGLIGEIAPFLFDHSLHNGHPRFFGYITSSAAPLGALADLLAAGINQNCSMRNLAPAANEIEIQTIRWLAELIGFEPAAGGIMVSGGNVANLLALFAARRARLPWDVRRNGVGAGRPRVYASRETHTWIEKAVDVAGIGTGAIRWIGTDSEQRIDLAELEATIAADRAAGDLPFFVVGTAGNVSTGAIDPLDEIAAIAAARGLWFLVDGAYGAPAACLPEAPPALKALALADSVALDPHKWLYAPLEAACTLVREPDALRAAFSFRPSYYELDDKASAGGIEFFEHGLQNSRGFRALKVWLGLRQAGRSGYVAQIRSDIALAGRLHARAAAAAELEAGTLHLSIATFRYRPRDALATPAWKTHLDRLNRELVLAVQRGGEAYLSNAIVNGGYYLRACIVNFRTSAADVDALTALVLRHGREIDARIRQESGSPA
jgi:glutamate/tyrosine decarboxylase-like PLP-dependent enzyme